MWGHEHSPGGLMRRALSVVGSRGAMDGQYGDHDEGGALEIVMRDMLTAGSPLRYVPMPPDRFHAALDLDELKAALYDVMTVVAHERFVGPGGVGPATTFDGKPLPSWAELVERSNGGDPGSLQTVSRMSVIAAAAEDGRKENGGRDVIRALQLLAHLQRAILESVPWPALPTALERLRADLRHKLT